jgi:hypothetical protein
MSKIANPKLASVIADGIVKTKAGMSALSKKETDVVYEHMQHHYDKEEKIIRQSCMKAAASCYNPPFGEQPKEIASKIIEISEILFSWVTSK